mgnify:CR=1 FL=1
MREGYGAAGTRSSRVSLTEPPRLGRPGDAARLTLGGRRRRAEFPALSLLRGSREIGLKPLRLLRDPRTKGRRNGRFRENFPANSLLAGKSTPEPKRVMARAETLRANAAQSAPSGRLQRVGRRASDRDPGPKRARKLFGIRGLGRWRRGRDREPTFSNLAAGLAERFSFSCFRATADYYDVVIESCGPRLKCGPNSRLNAAPKAICSPHALTAP